VSASQHTRVAASIPDIDRRRRSAVDLIGNIRRRDVQLYLPSDFAHDRHSAFVAF
jgi:hypothetical protein